MCREPPLFLSLLAPGQVIFKLDPWPIVLGHCIVDPNGLAVEAEVQELHGCAALKQSYGEWLYDCMFYCSLEGRGGEFFLIYNLFIM